MDNKVQRLVLKKDDVLVVRIPIAIPSYTTDKIKKLADSIRNKLPRKNAVLIVPENVKLEVIAKEELNEIIEYADNWELWGDE